MEDQETFLMNRHNMKKNVICCSPFFATPYLFRHKQEAYLPAPEQNVRQQLCLFTVRGIKTLSTLSAFRHRFGRGSTTLIYQFIHATPKY